MRIDRNNGLMTRVPTLFIKTFGLGRAMALTSIIAVFLIIVFAVFWFFHSAPPDTITITIGPEGSVFQTIAQRYVTILARDRVKLKILPSPQGGWPSGAACPSQYLCTASTAAPTAPINPSADMKSSPAV